MARKRTYYEILGVPTDATEKVIKQAYHALAMQLHPDRNPGNPEAEEAFKEAAAAYEVLSNPGAREDYDLQLRGVEFGAFPPGGGAVVIITGPGGFEIRFSVGPGVDISGTIFEEAFGGRPNAHRRHYDPGPEITRADVENADMYELSRIAAMNNLDFGVKLRVDERLIQMLKTYHGDLDENWLDSMLCGNVGNPLRIAAGLRWVRQTNDGQTLLAILDTGNLPYEVSDAVEAKLVRILGDMLEELDSLGPHEVWEKEAYSWAGIDMLENILYEDDESGRDLRVAAGLVLVKIYAYDIGLYDSELVEMASTSARLALLGEVKEAAEGALIKCIKDPSGNVNPRWLKALAENAALGNAPRVAAGERLVDETEDESVLNCLARSPAMPDEVKRYSKEKLGRVRAQTPADALSEPRRLGRHTGRKQRPSAILKPNSERSAPPQKHRR